MPYIDAELRRRERISVAGAERGGEINVQRELEARLSYSSSLTIQEVAEALKTLKSLGERGGAGCGGKDPEIPFFRKMVAEARYVGKPQLIHGTGSHRAQRVVLKNGRARYEE